MADRYWVGGTGTWNTSSTTNWSATSGGGSGASVPTVADSVFFDQAGTYTVTMTGALACLDITVSAGTVTFATGTGPSLNIRGSMTLLAGTVWTSDAAITFSSTTTGRTVTTNGVSFPNSSGLNFSGAGGGWTLGSAISATNAIVNFTQGTLDTSSSGNYSITVFRFSITGALTRTLNLNSSTVTVISGVGNTVEISGSNLTFNAGTSQINIPGANPSFYGPGYTFYNVAFTSTSEGTRSITDPFSTGLNTAYNNLSVTGPASVGVVTLSLAGPQTINGTLSTTGTAGNRRVFFTTANYGISQDLVVNSAPSLTDADFRGLYVRGTAAPISGTRIGNRGECRGITFSTPKTVYWNLAGTNNWDANGWAATSGGTPNTDNFPLPQDTAVINNTNPAVGNTISIGTAVGYLPSVDFSSRTVGLTFSPNAPVPVYGNWTNGSGISISVGSSLLTFSGGTTQTITSAGKTFSCPITVDTYGGTVQLADALNIGGSNDLTVTNGTFNTAGYAVTARLLNSSNSNVRAINLGSSTATLGSGFSCATVTNLSFNSGTSQINIGANAPTFNSGGLTFYNVTFTSTNTSGATFSSSNIFNSLTFTASASGGVSPHIFAANQTINGTLTCAGATAVRRIFLRSNTIGTPRTLTVNAISATDCDFRDITLAGAASGASPTRAGNCGGNTGITFPVAKTVYWNLAGTQDWSATGWATGSGGTPAVNNFPLAQDTAVFDDTGSVTGTITINAAWNIGTFDASLRTSAMTLSTSTNAPVVYGDWKFGTGVTSSSTTGTINFSKNGTQTITSNGVQFGCPVTINHPLANVQLADALSLNSLRTLSLLGGIFDAVTYNVTAGLFLCSGSTNTLRMGSGTWTISGTGPCWSITSIGAAIAGTSTIVLSDTSATARTFNGASLYYNKLTIGGTTGISTLTISGANTFGELASTKTVAHTITFPASNTTTVGKWSVTGTAGNVVTVNSSTAATAFTLSIAGPANSGIDYLSVRDCLVSPTSPGEFYVGANSTNVSNNTRVIFTATPAPRTLYWVGGTGNWSSTTKWSTSSGGGSGAAIPTSLDAVNFDALSNATAYTATIDAGVTLARCASFTMAGPLTGNVTFAGNTGIAFHGNVSFAATGITRTYFGIINWAGNGSYTFTTNGLGFQSSVTVIGIGATWTLGSALNIGPNQLTVTYGTFDTSVSNYNFNFSTFSSGNQNIRSVVFNASTITAASISASPATNLTFNAGTSQINLTSSTPSISGGLTFYNLSFTGGSVTTVNIADINTFNTLSFAGRTSVGITPVTFSANQTIGTLTLNAGTASAYRTFLASNTIGTQRTLNVTTLTAGAADIDFRDIAITGAAAPLTGTRFGDAKGNSGITFPAAKTVYWALATSNNWGATGAGTWSATNGGAAANTQFPLAQDTAFIPFAVPNNNQTITVNANYNIGTLDMNERNGSALLTLATSFNTPSIYGNWINGTGTTLTGTGQMTFAGRGTQTLTSAGKTFPQQPRINTPGGSVVLQDAAVFSVGGALILDAGTLNANGYNITLNDAASSFSSSSGILRTIAIGAGTFIIAGTGGWQAGISANLTVTGTGTISLTSASAKTFFGGGISYSGITLNQGGAGTLTISGNNTFKDITNTYSATGATTISLGNTTQTLTSPWTATGAASRVLTVSGTSAASPATLVFTGAGAAADVDYLAINNVRAYDLVDEWYAGPNSTNGGSLGWYFIAKPSGNVYAVTVTETGTGTDAITAKVTLLGTISETGTGTDSISSSFLYLRAVSESATVTDSNFAAFQPKANITETATGSDVESAILSAISLIAETATGSDTDLARLVAGATLTETATGTDTDAAALTVRPTITETATGSDTEAARYIARPSISETATGTDAENALYIANPTISETATGSDDDSAKLTVRPNISETGTITDADVGRISFPTTITETATGSDAEATRYIARPVISETATGSDADVAILTVRPAIIEAATGSDSDSAILTARPSISETATGSDTDSAKLTAQSVIAELATITDAASARATLLAAVIEAATITDLPSAIKGLFAYILESVTATDSINAPGSTYNPSLSESATATDNIVALTVFVAQIVEATTAADVVAAFKSYFSAVLETASGADSVAAQFTAQSIIAESATGADAETTQLITRPSVIETATGTDADSAQHVATPSINETATGTDAETTRYIARPFVSETATGADAETTQFEARSAINETATGTDADAAIFTAQSLISEAVIGADTVSPQYSARPSVAETATGTDAASTRNTTSPVIVETASGADSTNAIATFRSSLIESSTVQDIVQAYLTTVGVITELATGADQVSALRALAVAIAETASTTDTVAAKAIFQGILQELATAQDAVNAPGSTYSAPIVELATLLDAVLAKATFPVSLNETATGTETVQATFIPYAQITETATITDAASALAIFAARTVESAYITDEVSPPGSIYNPVVLAVAQLLDQVSPPGSIYNAPVLESATISDSLIGGFLWIDVNDDQVANWGDINNVQTTTWLAVDDSQTTNWQNVNNTQTSGWTDVDDTQTPGWNPVLP